MNSLDDSTLQRILSEAVQLGSALFGSERVVVNRARVLAEHGISREEDARQFDEFILRRGGSLRRVQRTEAESSGICHEPHWKQRPTTLRRRISREAI